MMDLAPFAYALTYGPRLREGRPVLYGPPGTQRVLRQVPTTRSRTLSVTRPTA